MPLALDPKETFEVVLESDALSPMPHPVFVFRYGTYRQWRENIALLGEREAVLSEEPAADYVARSELIITRMLQALERRYVCARNLGGREDDPLDEILTRGEIIELFYAAQRQVRLETAEKKCSESQSPISSDGSATVIPAGPATVETPPAGPVRSV